MIKCPHCQEAPIIRRPISIDEQIREETLCMGCGVVLQSVVLKSFGEVMSPKIEQYLHRLVVEEAMRRNPPAVAGVSTMEQSGGVGEGPF